jgi:ribosomal protein S18 acetylase RimI-like enzyme
MGGPLPDWAPVDKTKKTLGFYPEWDNLPEKAGGLSNIYFRPEYRGMGLGNKLMEIAMAWFDGFPDINLVFIYISNGNDEALKFYLKHGFTFSHEVFGGFITAVYKYIK